VIDTGLVSAESQAVTCQVRPTQPFFNVVDNFSVHPVKPRQLGRSFARSEDRQYLITPQDRPSVRLPNSASTPLNTVIDVLLLGSCPQMPRIEAGRIVAMMPDHQPLGDTPVDQFVHMAVPRNASSTHRHEAVLSCLATSHTHPAAGRRQFVGDSPKFFHLARSVLITKNSQRTEY